MNIAEDNYDWEKSLNFRTDTEIAENQAFGRGKGNMDKGKNISSNPYPLTFYHSLT